MTLVIAGYSYDGFAQESIYFAADSNISQNNIVLVNGFKKVIEMPIKLKVLSFSGEWFNDYRDKLTIDANCAIAFAGSTLVAQHMINSIKNHLSNLYPSYKKGQYILSMMCEGHKHLRNGYYDESMFTTEHLNSLINAKYISDVVEHSINSVLNQARKFNSMKRNFGAYQAEFILGIQCPQTRNYHIYKYEIVENEKQDAIVKRTEINKSSVATIGSAKYKQDLFQHEIFKTAFGNRVFYYNKTNPLAYVTKVGSFSLAHDYTNANLRIYKLLNETIEYENNNRVIIIGKPSVLYKLENGILRNVKIET